MRRAFSWLLGGLILAAFLVPFSPAVAADGLRGMQDGDLYEAIRRNPRSVFRTCPVSKRDSKTFALCATATCWTLDNVAYCKCDVMHEKSISLPFNYREDGEKRDVCDILQDGVGNGFTVSTYATPRELEADYDPATEKLGAPLALYDCDSRNGRQAGYSAQCDGGLCFNSTRGKDFPGFGRLKKSEIICSCPPVTSPPTGFQITGPWNCAPGDPNTDGHCCDRAYQARLCGVSKVSRTGTEIAVGAPTGVATTLSRLLDGKAPAINRCSL